MNITLCIYLIVMVVNILLGVIRSVRSSFYSQRQDIVSFHLHPHLAGWVLSLGIPLILGLLLAILVLIFANLFRFNLLNWVLIYLIEN